MTDGGHLPSDASLVPQSGQRTDAPDQPVGIADPLTDPLTGPLPGGGLPGGGAWPGEHRPAYTFLDQLDEEDDVLLMPGPQTAWGDAIAHGAVETVMVEAAAGPAVVQPVPVQPAAEAFAPIAMPPAEAVAPVADTMSLRTLEDPAEPTAPVPPGVPVEPSWPPLQPLSAEEPAAAAEPVAGQAPAAEQTVQAQAARRPLHAGPPIPDPSLMTGHVPVRSLADRGPSGAAGSTPAHGVPVPAAEPVAPVQPLQQQPVAVPAAVQQPGFAPAPGQDGTAGPQAVQTTDPSPVAVAEQPVAAAVTTEQVVAAAPQAAPAAEAVAPVADT
ncbi:hypothetical protein ACFQMG_20930, partial [Kitasatospora paranensis]